MIKAGIDIGSNSVRLLVKDGDAILRQEVEEPRLGKGFTEGVLKGEPVQDTIEIVTAWVKELKAQNINNPLIFATSAVRDAKNSGEFAQNLETSCGVPLRILSGEEEAYYSFTGAVSGFDIPAQSCLLIDIGGGSTELAAYSRGKLDCFSMPMGAVRWQVSGAKREQIHRMMASSVTMHSFDGVTDYIGVGGTVTTAAAVMAGVTEYTRDAIHGRILTYGDVTELRYKLENLTPEQRKAVPGLPEKRSEIITYGLGILEILFEILNIPKLRVSDYGIIDGILV